MNPGTFAGPGTGVPYGSISRYIQTPTITSSRIIAVPPGTQRIEALLCGGGGSGSGNLPAVTSYGVGGGFGGCAVVEIPITGSPLQVVIGAGGASVGSNQNGNAGSPTYIVSAGTRYGEVGGGGAGGNNLTITSGRSGGGGGGYLGNGGGPPLGKLLWTCYPQQQNASNAIEVWSVAGASYGGGPANGVHGSSAPLTGGGPASVNGGSGSFGAGGGSGGVASDGTNTYYGIPGYGAGGTFGVYGTNGNGWHNGVYGGGGTSDSAGNAGSGGSLTAVSIWGYTGFAGGTATGQGCGGGGGMLGAGGSVAANIGGNGGNGGGGGGGGYNNTSGAGGNGFAAIRFYL